MPTDKLKIKVNPFFLVPFVLFCCLEGVENTLIIYASALIHETGHLVCGRFLKGKAEKLYILPFGMRIDMNFSKMSYKGEFLTVFAGPVANILVWVVCFVINCFFTVPYISFVMASNFLLAAVNLLPAMPLDGGQMLRAFLMFKLYEERATFWSDVITLITLLFIFAFGVFILIRSKNNFSLIFLSVFFLISLLRDKIFQKDNNELQNAK